MRGAMIGEVWRKELLSTLRDRRAIVSNLLIPLLMLPLVMLGLPLALGGLFEREQETVTDLAVSGADRLPAELRAALEAQNLRLVEMTGAADVGLAVREDEAPVGLAVPADFGARLEASDASLTIYSKEGNLRSELNASKVRSAVQGYRQQLVGERLRAAGVDPAVLEPIALETVDASSAAERSSGQLSWLIPFFIAIWTLTGGQMTALDATAGEKERGTLEALLVTPIRRGEVVIGKFLATLTTGLSAAIMAILGYVLGGAVLARLFLPRLGEEGGELVSAMGGALDVTLDRVLLLLASALLLAAFIAALLIAVTMFARSIKEAQSYVAPFSFVLILPAVALQFIDLIGGGTELYLIPIFNVLLLMDDIVKGGATALHVAVTWAVMLAALAVALVFANLNFRREGVIFRS